MNETVYWIWLSLCCTPDSATFPRLLEKFKCAEEIFNATDKQISACIGNNASDRSLLLKRDLSEAERIYDFCTKRGVGIVTYASNEYPTPLKSIPTPPVLLYYRGQLPDFSNRFCIATVGTRALSDYGRRSAFKISYDLASAGATVVSGMAMGIDGVALAGALSAGGSTVAVIGSGIDVCYPSGHLTLAREIVKSGCVMTEFPPGTPPNRFNFPRRNRIISGLSAATLVIEGKEKSGALITARYAKAQGRAVYAIPGNVGSPNSEVSNLLIKNGAKLCTSADDIVHDFETVYPSIINPFALKESLKIDIMSELRRYGVIAVCPSDPIFDPPKPKRRRGEAVPDSAAVNSDSESEHGAVELNEPPSSFDGDALRIYKKIPLTGECTIESLVDDELPLRDVMRLLLKLEVGKFVVILPGELVKRKAK